MVHLFVVHGYQGAEEDPDKLQLADELLQAVLAKAQVVCLGQPLLIAVDLNADPAVIPCLAKGISAGRFVDLALAYSLAEGEGQMLLANSGGRIALVHVGTSFWVALMRWLLPRLVCQPVWSACWIDTPDESSSSVSRAVRCLGCSQGCNSRCCTCS